MKHITRLFILLSLILLAFNGTPAPVSAQSLGGLTRLMVGSHEFNNGVEYASMSKDGRYIAFTSHSSNLVADDLNNSPDVFVYDRQTDTISLISVSPTGTPSYGIIYIDVVISGNGRYVAFTSDANNLVVGDTNGQNDVFVRDLQTNQTTRVSVDSNGNQVSHPDFITGIDISDDGRYVVFESDAPNLVIGDTNNAMDVFLHDRQTGQTIRASVDSSGNQLANGAARPRISGNGRYVMFTTVSPDVVANDTNDQPDVFVKDMQTGQVTRVSVSSSGGESFSTAQSPYFPITLGDDISYDGRYVTFVSNANNLVTGDTNGDVWDQFWHDRQTGETRRVSVSSAAVQADDTSGSARVTDDGRYVFFESFATNLVLNDTNGSIDAFRHDIQTATTIRISVDEDGNQANADSGIIAFSEDLNTLMFLSWATNLVSNDMNSEADIFIYNALLSRPTLISPEDNFETIHAVIYLNWSDLQWSLDYQVQVATDNTFTNIVDDIITPNTSYNYVPQTSGIYYWRVRGRIVSFNGMWSGVRKFTFTFSLFGENIMTRFPINGIQYNQPAFARSVSNDGRFVLLESTATNFIAGDTDTYADVVLWDIFINEKILVSANSMGVKGNHSSHGVDITNNGRYILITSLANNLVPNDTNNQGDLFLLDRETNTVEIVSISSDGTQGTYHGNKGLVLSGGSMSDDGRFIAFSSWLNFLVAGDNDDLADLFLHDRQTGETIHVEHLETNPYGFTEISVPVISSDGRFIAYHSEILNGISVVGAQVFVYDRQTGEKEIVSVSSDGIQGDSNSYDPQISDDGRYIAFSSFARNLVVNDTNWVYDVFVYDRYTGQTTRVSVDSNDIQANGPSSGRLELSHNISSNGRFIIFGSSASNLVPNDVNNQSDIFIHDYVLGTTTLVSLTPRGLQGNANSYKGWIHDNGIYTVFLSNSSNFVLNDTNNKIDTFIRNIISPMIPATPNLTLPVNFSLSTELTQIFEWDVTPYASSYQIQIANDSEFNNIVYNGIHILPTHNQSFSTLDTYYWRVRGTNSLGDGPWSTVYEFTIGTVQNDIMDEQQLFNMAQPMLTNGMTFALFDVTPTGIITTTQFDDGGVVTGNIRMTVQNGLLLITVDGLSGGSTEQQDMFRDSMPAMMMNMLDEMLPDNYLAIEMVTMSDMGLDIGLVMPNP